MKDKRTSVLIISVSALAIALAVMVTFFNPSQDLSFAFGEPKKFEEHFKSCLEKVDNVVDCLPVTISPSSGAPEDASQTSIAPVNTEDQLSLVQQCSTNNLRCVPHIENVQRDIYQVPYTELPTKEVILEVQLNLVPVTNVRELADEIVNTYKVVLVDSIDTPAYKAIVIQAPEAGNLIFNDSRFVDYDLPNNLGRGELDEVTGHIAQVKWNQIVPYGLERTIPISNATNEGDHVPVSTAGGGVNNSDTATTHNAAIDKMRPFEPSSVTTINRSRSVDVDIAILDTGISLNHPDLNVYRNISFVEGSTLGNDEIGHGSHVAGIAAAKDNSIGIVGVAPDARLWAIKVCDTSGECKISNQIKGVEYAIRHADEIDVLNISIENPNSPALNNIISAAVKEGITVIVSAGNYGKDASTTTPANNPDVMTVSAVGDSDGKCGGLGPVMGQFDGNVTDDTFAYFSNFGPAVKMAAPGVNILSTYTGSGYAVDSGTSMAAPYVTGAAALYKSENPDASPADVIANLTRSGSLPTTLCDGGAHGYFKGDLDKINEPLLFREINSNN